MQTGPRFTLDQRDISNLLRTTAAAAKNMEIRSAYHTQAATIHIETVPSGAAGYLVLNVGSKASPPARASSRDQFARSGLKSMVGNIEHAGPSHSPAESQETNKQIMSVIGGDKNHTHHTRNMVCVSHSFKPILAYRTCLEELLHAGRQTNITKKHNKFTKARQTNLQTKPRDART